MLSKIKVDLLDLHVPAATYVLTVDVIFFFLIGHLSASHPHLHTETEKPVCFNDLSNQQQANVSV